MSRFLSKRAVLTALTVLGVAVGATLLAPHVALAQELPFDPQNAGTGVARLMAGVFRVLKLAVVAASLIFGFINFFRASRGGDTQGWINGLLLFIVAAFALAPDTLLGLVGMDEVGDAVVDLLNGTWNP